jgi:hypothetical protein
MALRLKYDDIKTDAITADLQSCLHDFVSKVRTGQTGTIFATYTAMLELRHHLSKITEVERV